MRSVRSTSWLAALLLSSATVASAAPGLPAKDSGNIFFTYGMGYTTIAGNSELFIYTGDSIYQFDEGTSTFTLNKSGLRSAFGPPPRSMDGGFATGPDGQAMVMTGFAGGNSISDLTAGLSAFAPAPSIDVVINTDNVYSAASQADNLFYVQYSNPNTFSNTEIYLIDSAAPSTTFAVDPVISDPLPGVAFHFSGAMSFDAAGNLVIGVLGYDGTFTVSTVGFYQISAAELAAFEADPLDTPAVTLLGSTLAGGNARMVVTNSGDIYFSTTRGIARFDPLTDSIIDILGDVTESPFITPNEYEGLAYDPINDRLAYGFRNSESNQIELAFYPLAIPEPASFFALAGISLLMLRRRQTIA